MAKFDDELPHHRKIRAAGKDGPAVLGWYCAGVAFCRRQLTDGVIRVTDIPAVMLGYTAVPKRILAHLTCPADPGGAGLWESIAEGTWRIHDYLDHNASAEEIRDRRQRDLQRKRGHLRAETGPVTRDPGGRFSARDSTVDSAMDSAVDSSSPTRPDPTRPDTATGNPDGTGGGRSETSGYGHRGYRPVSKATQLHPTGMNGLPRDRSGKKPTGSVARVLEDFGRRFQAKMAAAPELTPADTTVVEDLLKRHQETEILGLFPGFFSMGTAWIRSERAYTLRAFRHAYSELVAMQARGDFRAFS